MYYLCSTSNSDGVVGYLFYDADQDKIKSCDYNTAVSLITQHKVENGKLENTIIKATDCIKSVRLTAEKLNTNTAYYILPAKGGLLRAVSNTGELFIMSPNVAPDFFHGKILLNAAIRGNRIKVFVKKKFTSPLNRDYSFAQTK